MAAAASLGAIASRHVVGNDDQADTADAMQQALTSDSPSGPDVDAALGEMRERSADPQAYVMAAAVFTEVRDPTEVLVLRLFELAGVDPRNGSGRAGGTSGPRLVDTAGVGTRRAVE